MQILAIIDFAVEAGAGPSADELASELQESWKLLAAGVLRQAYATAQRSRVIFLLEARNVEDGREELMKLPLVARGMFRLELIELRPFTNWSLLFAQ